MQFRMFWPTRATQVTARCPTRREVRMSVTQISVEELCGRYRKLYTGAIADVLDDKGLWHQIVDHRIQPLSLDMRVAGPAITMLGRPERSTDRAIRKGVKAVD